jgi:hypothetical protein
MGKILFGASFSHRHFEGLGIDPLSALKEFASLGLTWIRLGCYWNEIEAKKGVYDFKKMEALVKAAQSLGLNIILTVGMKAPRYPEYYLPFWLVRKLKQERLQTLGWQPEIKESLMLFVENTIKTFKEYQAIKVWQVENEPLDPSGPLWQRVDQQILTEEVSLVRDKDAQKRVMINLWGGELSKRRIYSKLISLADIVGLDIYFRTPFLFWGLISRFSGPSDSDETIKKIITQIKSSGKEVWLAELQAEPWEFNEIWTKKENPKSCLPEQIISNVKRVSNWNLDGILLWGFEYWYWRKLQGDSRYWEAASKAIDTIK